MAFGVTPEGFVIKPLETIRQEVEDDQRSGIDPGLDLGDLSLLGQVNGPHIGKLAELWELGAAVYASQYPDSASGDSLTSVSSITGTTRNGSSKTLVEAVEVTLNPGAALPINSVANISGQPSARFLSQAALPGSAEGGIFTVDFLAEANGAQVVAAEALSEIAEPVIGWTSVSNPTIGSTGSEIEDDTELRIQREGELESQGSTSVSAIRADLLRLDGMIGANVFENDTDNVVDDLRPHSIHCITRGGDNVEIAAQILTSKAAGINTNGTVELQSADSQGTEHTIRFSPGTPIAFFAKLTLVVDLAVFDIVSSPVLVQAAVADGYVNALSLGQTVIYDQVKCAALSVGGAVSFEEALIGFNGPPTLEEDLPVAQDRYAKTDGEPNYAGIEVVIAGV